MGEGPKRPVIEVMVLMITGTVCVILLLMTGGIVVIETVHPEVDTSGAVSSLSSIVTTLLGAVLGLIAGHSLGRGKKPPSSD